MIFFDNVSNENDELNYFSEKFNDCKDFYSQDEDNKIDYQNPNEPANPEGNLFDQNYLENLPINLNFPIKNLLEIPISFSMKTEADSKDNFLQQKRCREETECYEQEDNVLVEEKEAEKEEKEVQMEEPKELQLREEKIENTLTKQKDNNIVKNRGRRKKDELYKEEAEHDKFKSDNIIQKIKTFIFKYILEILNNSLIDSRYKFYPLDKNLNVNLKKDFNEELMQRTIYDIFMNSELNERHKNGNYSNKRLIKKIFEEKYESKTIKILQMKYIDVLNLIREKDLQYFLGKIMEKEQKNKGTSIDSYMKDVNIMLNNYENWFERKLGRSTKKQKNKEF